MLNFEPGVGVHIQHACERAVDIANRNREQVSFRFNDVHVVVSPGETADKAVARWTDVVNQNAEAYRNSPEGKAAERLREARQAYFQCETEDLIAQLPDAVGDLRSLVRWCVSLSKSADHVGIAWKPGEIADVIESAGWKANAHVGRAKEDFEDTAVMGEYLIGQSIDCLRKGMPPHPIIEGFAERGGFLRKGASNA